MYDQLVRIVEKTVRPLSRHCPSICLPDVSQMCYCSAAVLNKMRVVLCIMNWKGWEGKTVMVSFRVLSQYLPGLTKED